jgi:signal transduction histidine kinase
MTPTDLILSLRPADGSSTAITAAIERARTALAGVDNDISAAQQEHDRELLDAEPSRLQDLTKRFTKTREDLAGTRDRVSAVLAQLEDRLIAARRDEAEEILAAKREKVEAAGRALVKLLESKRAKLAADLRELELADTAYADAQREFATISARPRRGY